MTAALLFGGAFQTTADASASENNKSIQTNVYYSINGSEWTEGSSERFSNFLNEYLPQINWNKQQSNHKEQPEQDKPEEQDAPEESGNAEQGNTEQDKSEQEDKTAQQDKQQQEDNSEQQADKEQEQNADKPEAQAPQQPAEQQSQQNQQNEQNQQSQSQDAQQLSEFEQQVVELTNQEREAQGLEPLKVDTELSKVAREKSRDMATNNYFSHDSPNYGSPFDMMEQYGISYQTAGENIAKGQTSPEQVVNGWMNSEGHRENIMNANFTHIGVGYVEQGNHWTQQFIGK